MTIRTRVAGKVHYNDGQFAEIQTVGTEGIDENLLLDTIQLHREDTDLLLEQFQSWFIVCRNYMFLIQEHLTQMQMG